MKEKKKGIDLSAAWKKDDWMAVWIGFIILIIFIAGMSFKTPSWTWMSNRVFHGKTSGWVEKVNSLIKEGGAKGGESFRTEALALKSALQSGNRKTIANAAGKFEKASKEVGDGELQKNAGKLGADIKKNASSTIGKVLSGKNLLPALYLLVGFWILSCVAMLFMGIPVGNFMKGFPIIFILSAISFLVAGNTTISHYGLEVVFWALIIGLFISNVFGVPEWLRHAVKTEFFIKIGIVMLGAEVLFRTIVSVGAYGLIQAVVVIGAVFYVCFWVAKKFGLDDEFAAILGTAVSICGVSAAIAAGGAIKGDQKKVSHTISLVLLCAIPMLIFEPIVIKALNINPTVAGAWIGGTIDTTGAVVAAGSIAGERAMAVSVVVKMTQNVFIGIAAFLLAIWFVFKKNTTDDRPGGREIWYRFPKFVLGFLIASLVMSFLMPEAAVKTVTGITKSIRGWWFTLAFLCIGLDTRFKELFSMGRGKPAGAFLIAQGFNIVWTLLIAYLLFGGVLFPLPKF